MPSGSIRFALIALLLPAPALAGPPAQVVSELGLWRRAVESEDPARIAGRMIKGQRIEFRLVGGGQDEPLRLDREALEKRLQAGQADRLGLARLLLLPHAKDLTPSGDGRWVAMDRRCPEVRWIFAKRGARWRLTRVERHLLGC